MRIRSQKAHYNSESYDGMATQIGLKPSELPVFFFFTKGGALAYRKES